MRVESGNGKQGLMRKGAWGGVASVRGRADVVMRPAGERGVSKGMRVGMGKGSEQGGTPRTGGKRRRRRGGKPGRRREGGEWAWATEEGSEGEEEGTLDEDVSGGNENNVDAATGGRGEVDSASDGEGKRGRREGESEGDGRGKARSTEGGKRRGKARWTGGGKRGRREGEAAMATREARVVGGEDAVRDGRGKRGRRVWEARATGGEKRGRAEEAKATGREEARRRAGRRWCAGRARATGGGSEGDRLFNEAATEEKGERARLSSFVGAMAISDLVKSTLGPKGMDKILQSTSRGGGLMVTNDGATILKALHIDNPAAKVLVDISKVQDDEVGDGTTSVVVLAGELLREAEKLVTARIHPMTIISGYRMALDCAREVLISKSRDNKDDPAKFREDLLRIAKTTLSSKILSQDKEHFASLAVDAVLRLKGGTNLEAIQIIKKAGGALSDSYLDEGFILDKKIGVGQPKRIENARILVANTAMDTDKVKIYGARVRVDGMAKVAEIEAAEKNKMRQKVEKIIAHGINCFINRQLIYNFPEELFSDAGVMAIEHADFEGIERLALVTGGEIASTFEDPAGVKLGQCKVIEEIMIGEDRLIHFSGVALGEACTIVLRGASSHVLDEAERSLHDALCVLTATVADSRVVWGGGWPEVMMATRVDDLARRTPGKRALAVEAFASALRAIPTIIADNAGLDSAELVAQLRAAHAEENSRAGIDVITGQSGDMEECGIYESLKVKQAVLMSATEAAEMILRVDDIITNAPRRREERL
ncbi:unnamed protein product [Closterium sp. Naga37s-1]|nr:unnamed protein product [Closterium sp. Naga37s-1]